MSRTFIGIKIQPATELLEALDKYQHVLRKDSIKWVDSSNFHITLHFLGQITDERIKNICDGLSEIAEKTDSFAFQLKGIGVFPNPWRPKVFFTGTDKTSSLESLYESVEKMVEACGFEREKRSYHAHLTFGRIKYLRHSEKLHSLLEQDKYRFFQEVAIAEIVLFESVTKATGTVYEPIAKFPLGK